MISFYLKNNDEIIKKDNIENKRKKDELLFI